MQSWIFKSLVLSNEIDLPTIASHFGITAKFKWEDPLILRNTALSGILKDTGNKIVYIYYFGSIVFINMEYHEIQDVIKYIKNIDTTLQNNNISDQVSDEYRLNIDTSHEFALYNDIMTSNKFYDYYIDIIAIVLAKSTALRKIELDINKLLDRVEDIINFLDTGKLNMSDKQLARTSAKILRYKYNTISYLMVLEKPRAAWNDEDVEKFFEKILDLFELKERYERINLKTDILQDITDVFSSVAHEKRATKLEVMVVLLILVELIISFIEFILKI